MSKWETGILAVGLGAAIAYGIQHETRSIPHTMSEVTRLETDLSESLESVERLEGEVQQLRDDMEFVMRMPVCTCK